MKATRGQADAARVQELVLERCPLTWLRPTNIFFETFP